MGVHAGVGLRAAVCMWRVAGRGIADSKQCADMAQPKVVLMHHLCCCIEMCNVCGSVPQFRGQAHGKKSGLEGMHISVNS